MCCREEIVGRDYEREVWDWCSSEVVFWSLSSAAHSLS